MISLRLSAFIIPPGPKGTIMRSPHCGALKAQKKTRGATRSPLDDCLNPPGESQVTEG
jgi:hypothetical protein